jgi:hypothetical protein
LNNTPFSFPFEAQFDPHRAQEYVILSLIRSTMNTAELVRVQAVQPETDRVGFVTVQPLVLDADTNNIVLAQSPAYNVPYLRVQGGVSAVILDPEIGDIGLAVYSQRDITTIKATLEESPAPTARTFSTADGLYFGGFLNAAPTQWIKFLPGAGGIQVVSPADIDLNATGNINLQAAAINFNSTGNTTVTAAEFIVNAPAVFNGTISGTATGAGAVTFAAAVHAPDVILPAGAVNTHDHGGVMPGTSNTHPMDT